MATGPSLGPGDVEDALAAYGPLTDVWQVVAASSGAVTVQLAKTSGAVPYIAPSLVPHYEGALVRFTTGPLSGGGPGEQWNTTIRGVASTPTATTVTFGDTWPTDPSSGDQFTVIRGAGIGTSLSLASGTTVSATFSGPVTLASGTTVDVGTIAGDVTLASGTTVALESGAVVDVGTISGAVNLASGTTVALGSGTTVDVGTIAGAVTLASGTTVALGSGAVVDVGTISGAVTLASGSVIELTGNPTVDVSGQSIVIESSNTDAIGASTAPFPSTVAAVDVGFYTVSGSAGEYEWQSVVVPLGTSPLPPQGLPVQVIGSWTSPGGTITPLEVNVMNSPTVTSDPDLTRTAATDVTVIAAGATASLGLTPTTIYQLTLMAGSTGSIGAVRLQNSSGPWLAVCGVNESAHVDWGHSGYANGGATLEIVNGSADSITAGVAIEYT